MGEAAIALGYEYVAICDHTTNVRVVPGLDADAVRRQGEEIAEANERLAPFRVLRGIECDILPDGSLDLADDCLAQLDLVIASVHSAIRQEEDDMTARLVRAIEHPLVDIIGHPTSRRLLRREPARLNLERVVAAAAHHGVALEINCQLERLDLSDSNARLARERGAKLVISSDAHSTSALAWKKWGVLQARRAWAQPSDVLNTLPFDAFRAALRRHRHG